jgi:hypothetical protein
MGLEEYCRVEGAASYTIKGPEALVEGTGAHEVGGAMLRRAALLVEAHPGYRLALLEGKEKGEIGPKGERVDVIEVVLQRVEDA